MTPAELKDKCKKFALRVFKLTDSLPKVEEEADETLYWLELIHESGMIKYERLRSLMKDADELIAIFTSSGKTAKFNNL